MSEMQHSDTMAKQPRCFCKIPITELMPWAYEKYIKGHTTVELLGRARTNRERELISIIAILDVEKKTLDEKLGHQTKPTCNLERCRKMVKQWLLAVVEEKKK